MEKIILTGMGLVSAYGYGVAAFEEGLLAGKDAFTPISRFATEAYRTRLAGQVRPAMESEHTIPVGQLRTAFLRHAVREALESGHYPCGQTNLLAVIMASPVGVSTGTAGEQGEQSIRLDEWLHDDLPMIREEVRSPVLPVYLNQACASGLGGLAYACTLLGAHLCEYALVVGVEVVNEFDHASMDAMRALSKQVARPFDSGRDGMLLGEGAGALLLRCWTPEISASAQPYLVIDGIGAMTGARLHVALDEAVVETCIRRALATTNQEQIGYLHANANGSPLGDEVELRVLARIFQQRSTPLAVSTSKGAIGHLLHCSSFPGVVAAARALLTGVLPPTIGYRSRRPISGLELLLSASERVLERALVNSFGLCGNNFSLVLSRPTAAA
jgi:3-oxoacyl-[acyl-carrier-protein] synthase II